MSSASEVLVSAATYDEHGWCTDALGAWPVDGCTSLLAPTPSSAFAVERWDHQARRFFGCEFTTSPAKRYEAGWPVLDRGFLELRRAGHDVTSRVEVRTFPAAREPALVARAAMAAAAMGGAGFDVLVRRTQRLWQLRAEAPLLDEDAEELAAAVLASVMLGPILARDGALFGVKTARERLERRRRRP
jgi:hypothetical protein